MRLSDSTIYKFSIIISAIGIALLFFCSLFSTIDTTRIDESFLGKRVQVQGMIENSFLGEKVLIFSVYSNESIKCVLFNPSENEIELVKKNSFVQITGTVKEYENEFEIVVESLQGLN